MLFSTILISAIAGCEEDQVKPLVTSLKDTIVISPSPSTSGFNRLFPDGTDDIKAGNFAVTASTPYTVPAGRNLHAITTDMNGTHKVFINGVLK